MHSLRIEPVKLILVGTRTTYQATGDAGACQELRVGLMRCYRARVCNGAWVRARWGWENEGHLCEVFGTGDGSDRPKYALNVVESFEN